MNKFEVGQERDFFEDTIKPIFDKGISVYIQPLPNMPHSSILKANGHTKVFDNDRNVLEDVVEKVEEIKASNFVLNAYILNLETDYEVVLFVADCVFLNGKVMVDEDYKKRFEKAQTIIPEEAQTNVYEIRSLPTQRLEGDTLGAEFQAALDWAADLDEVKSRGAIVKPANSSYGEEYIYEVSHPSP